MKIDLHVHTEESRRPSTWLLKKIGCAESYTEPQELYRIARERGMDAVTVTDHNTIDGALALREFPNTFVSVEATTYFPEDNCKLHVLCYDIDEEQFARIDKLRESVYDLVSYLQAQGIHHALAHPFYSVNERMTVEHFEQCLLLFQVMEFNGNISEPANDLLKQICRGLIPEDIERLARTHGIRPSFDEPWRKAFLGGSDDHSSLHIAHTYTEVPGAMDIDDFFAGVRGDRARVEFQRPATPLTNAQHLYGVAYQFYKNKFRLQQAAEHNVLVRFLDRMLQERERKESRVWVKIYANWKERKRTRRRDKAGPRNSLMDLLQVEAEKIVARDEALAEAMRLDPDNGTHRDKDWFRFVSQIGDTLLARLARHSTERLTQANPFDLFHTIGSTGALYTLVAPYFVSYGQYTKDRRLAEACGRRFLANVPSPARPRVGHFTDTLEEVNGVARTLMKQSEMARNQGKDLTLISCSADPARAGSSYGIRYFKAVDHLTMAEYDHQELFVPPVLEMMQFCYDRNFTHIHAATPGPVGLVGLAVSRIMKLPFFTTYHTCMPQYALALTDDPAIEELTWRFMLWFYDQSDYVFSPSQATANELIERGIDKDKVVVTPRGVDSEYFHPDHAPHAPALPEGPRILYAGRVSKEKNLPLLCRAFRKLHRQHPEAKLIVVGDGPYTEEMKAALQGLPAHFTGYLDGLELAGAFAACDFYVLPSTTDTFGNAVLEAQASGLPAIVSDIGGPQENVLHGETGLITEGDNERSLLEAMQRLVADPEQCRRMGEAARRYAAERDIEKAFDRYWQLYNQPALSEAFERAGRNGKGPTAEQAVSAGIESLEGERASFVKAAML